MPGGRHLDHPYFTALIHRIAPDALATDATHPAPEPVGHGTGESANIFAVAPDVQLLPVKMSFVNTTAAFNAAVGLGPDIITCSWGGDVRQGPLILLCHKFSNLFRAAQHGQRDSIVARAATNLRRIVAIEFGTWRSGRNGGSSGLVTFA